MTRATLLLPLVALALSIVWIELRTPPAALPTVAPGDVPATVEELARRIERLEVVAATAPAPAPAPREESAEPRPTAAGEPTAPEPAPEVRDLLRKVEAGTATTEEIDAIWELLTEVSPADIERAIATFRRRVTDRPHEADARYGLGLALSAKYTATKVTEAEMAALALEADRCFSKALEMDDHHFGARFCKAYSYALWPPNYGMGPEAIRHFEILARRHSGESDREGMEEVYYNLGKEYAKLGNFGKAAEWYREGLRDFPDSKAMRRELEAMERR